MIFISIILNDINFKIKKLKKKKIKFCSVKIVKI